MLELATVHRKALGTNKVIVYWKIRTLKVYCRIIRYIVTINSKVVVYELIVKYQQPLKMISNIRTDITIKINM